MFSISHVGLAIFNPKSFPTQWVLVLSPNETFQGRVICSTVCPTVNGWQEVWVECDPSPASFNRSAAFAGVIHIAVLDRSMDFVYSEIKSKGIVNDPVYTDRYVMKALGRINDICHTSSSILLRDGKELYEALRARIPLLTRYTQMGSSFPIASLSLDGVRFGSPTWD